MFILGDVYDEVIDAMKGRNNPDYQERAMRRFNLDLRAISRLTSWAEMRRKIQITYSGEAFLLPANLIGIDLVWDDDNEIEYIGRNRSSAEAEETAYRYFTYPVAESLVTVNDGSFSQDRDTFVSDELLASGEDVTDEYFYVEGEDQYYKILSNTDNLYTFTPAYRGKGTKSAVRITVRPTSQLMMDIVGPYGAEVSGCTLDIHYWQQPDIVRDMSDIVPLPTTEVLVRRVLRNLPEAQQRRPMSDQRVKEALDEAIRINPDRPRATVLRGIHGRKVNGFNSPYSSVSTDNLSARMVNRWQTNRI